MFLGDVTTGIYRSAADEIAFSTGGVQRGKWTSTSLLLSASASLDMSSDSGGGQRILGLKGNVVQITSNTTTVGANGMSGTIEMFGTIGAETSHTFIFNNGNMTALGQVLLTLVSAAVTDMRVLLSVPTMGAGTCTIAVFNVHTSPTGAAPKFRYFCIN